MKSNLVRAGLLALTVTLLASCASDERVVDPRDQMVGLNEDGVLACLGEPDKRDAAGISQIWRYTTGSISDTSSRACAVTVKLEAGKVADVSYQNLSTTRPDDECASALKRCAR